MMLTVNKVNIRPCTADDLRLLIDLGEQTFRETFEAVNTPENMDSYIRSTFNRLAFEREINEKGANFFIAEVDGEPVGFCKLNHSTKADGLQDANALEIERIYALKKVIGGGVGKALMEHCLDFAKQNAFSAVWLGVWEHNERAISFYKKWGFEFFGQHVFMLGEDVQTDLLMKKYL
jgi:diamine N-acetyltransferase